MDNLSIEAEVKEYEERLITNLVIEHLDRGVDPNITYLLDQVRALIKTIHGEDIAKQVEERRAHLHRQRLEAHRNKEHWENMLSEDRQEYERKLKRDLSIVDYHRQKMALQKQKIDAFWENLRGSFGQEDG